MSTNVHFDCLNANETKIALTLDELQNSRLRVCIFGVGKIGKEGFEFLNKKCSINIDCFCDNSPDKWGTKVFGIPVISLEELEKNKNEMVCVVFDQTCHIQIKKQLISMEVAHLVPIDLAKPLEIEKMNRDLEYIKTILLLQNFAPQLLKEMYCGFNINKDLAAKAAPSAFPALRQMDMESVRKMLYHLTNGIGVSPEVAFDVTQKVSKNPAFKAVAFESMLRIAHAFPKNQKINLSLKILNDELYGNRMNLAYVSHLLWQNKEQQALAILQSCKELNEDAICNYLPIAEFVYRAKIMKGEKLKMFAKVFNALKNNMKNNIVKKFVTGKSIAVVGNGPQELGKKNGTKIDSHDVVVRFNGFSTDKQFIIDYGKKTDIYVFSACCAIHDIRKSFGISAITGDPYLYGYPQDLVKFLYTSFPLDKLAFISTPEVMEGMYKDYCIIYPSSGARAIYYLKKVLRTRLYRNDIFGMALSSGKVEDGHYNNDGYSSDLRNFFGEWHNMYAEFEMYKHLFRNDKCYMEVL
jgi:hypothetical protein